MIAPLFPLIAAVIDAISLTLSKVFLRRFGRLTYKEFNWLIFLAIICVLVIASILTIGFPSRMAVSAHLLPILGLGLLGALSNIFFSRSLEEERVSELEPFFIFTPLAAILIASLVYPTERGWPIYVAIALAAATLLLTHLKGHKISLTRGLISVMIVWVIYGGEVVLIKHLLQFFAPLHLYLLRCVIVWISLSVVSRPDFRLTAPRHLPFAFLLGSLAVASVTCLYTGIKLLGAGSSLFTMVLSPILVYWFSALILKERWNQKNIFAGAIILCLVAGVTLWQLLT